MAYEISEDLLVRIGGYLSRKPYVEVVGFIDELKKLPEIKKEDKDDEGRGAGSTSEGRGES